MAFGHAGAPLLHDSRRSVSCPGSGRVPRTTEKSPRVGSFARHDATFQSRAQRSCVAINAHFVRVACEPLVMRVSHRRSCREEHTVTSSIVEPSRFARSTRMRENTLIEGCFSMSTR